MLFSIYLPAINATITESMAQTCDETRLKMLIASMGGLFQLLFHASLPRARIHNILSPDFAGSDFPGRDVFSDLDKCEVLKSPEK